MTGHPTLFVIPGRASFSAQPHVHSAAYARTRNPYAAAGVWRREEVALRLFQRIPMNTGVMGSGLASLRSRPGMTTVVALILQ